MGITRQALDQAFTAYKSKYGGVKEGRAELPAGTPE